MYIMCVVLFLFSALSRRVSALQMSILLLIIIIIAVVVVAAAIVIVRRRRSNPRKKCYKKDESYDNNAMNLKLKRSCSRQFYRPLQDVWVRVTLTRVGTAAARTHSYRCVQYCRVSKQWCGC